MVYTVDKTAGVGVYIDADFTGGWGVTDSSNAVNKYSCTVFSYAMQNGQPFGATNFR